jgi:hypothetical protein
MGRKQQPVSAGRSMAITLVLASAIAVEQGFVVNPKWYLWLLITIPLLVACFFPVRK